MHFFFFCMFQELDDAPILPDFGDGGRSCGQRELRVGGEPGPGQPSKRRLPFQCLYHHIKGVERIGTSISSRHAAIRLV